MKVWIGHYYQNPKEWFVVWANDIQEAWDTVDELGSPKGDSCREFSTPGLVNFFEKYDKEKGTIFSPAKDVTRRTNWLFLGAVGFPEEANEYIHRLYSERESSPRLNMKIWAASYLCKPESNKTHDASVDLVRDSFIVWAKNKQEALLFVESKMGQVDKDSFTEIVDSGFINFHVKQQGKQMICSPPKDDLKKNTWINTNVYAGPESEELSSQLPEDESESFDVEFLENDENGK